MTGDDALDPQDGPDGPVEPPDPDLDETAPPDPGPPDARGPAQPPDPPGGGPVTPATPGSPEDPLARFFTPFRPDQTPACPCRGGSYRFDRGDLLPRVTLYLHLHHDTITTGNGVARWEDHGPVTAAYIRDFLGPHARFTIKPVIDPATLAPVDAYEVPERHREALHLRTPADVFPYSPNTSRRQQIDHTIPYRPRTDSTDSADSGSSGQTGLHNLGPMTGYHHRVKTHAGWQLHQPIPGIYLWVAPHGSVYLVDHTGTRQLRGPGGHTHRATAPNIRPSSALEHRLHELLPAA